MNLKFTPPLDPGFQPAVLANREYVSAAKRAGDAVPLVIGLERERGLVIARLLREKPDAVLGLATGSTPLLLCRQLIAMKLNWRKVTTFNLDEYVGLGSTHPQSYHSFMQKNLFRHINISKKNIHIPDGMSRDIPGFCASYEKKIRAAGGIDFQVLGIGTDGHIGFNEPTSSLASRTRIKTLTRQTHKDNARFFGSAARVPHHVITMGLGAELWSRSFLPPRPTPCPIFTASRNGV